MEALTLALDPLTFGPPHTHGGLTMFPIVSPDAPPRTYQTLDEALAAKTARVSEISSAGSVPELCFVNEGDLPVLLLDGEELVGAKQNRVLNLTILVPAGRTVVIPVSCVEAGRWSSVSRHFGSSKQVMYAMARGRKSADVSAALGSMGRRTSRQSEVWSDVGDLAARYRVRSPTAKMTDVFEARDRDLDRYVRHLQPVRDQVGAAFAMRGKVEGVEIFDHPEVLARLLPKLVRSWALDVLDGAPNEEGRGDAAHDPPSIDAAEAFLAGIRGAHTQSHDAIGLGQDVRIAADHLAGGALIQEERLVHLCVFRADNRHGNADPGRGDGRGEPRMQPASRRRGRWRIFGFGRD